MSLMVIHIYFAVRPEKFFLTKGMIFGWITREKYLGKYDPGALAHRRERRQGRTVESVGSRDLSDGRRYPTKGK